MKIFKIFVGIIFLFFITVGVIFLVKVFSSVHEHNEYLHQLTEKFNRIEHLKSSQKELEFKGVGLLAGNGNHCDYLVGQIRASDVSRDEIQSFYDEMNRRNKNDKNSQINQIKIIFYNDGLLVEDDAIPEVYSHLSAIVPDYDKNLNYYIVYVFDGSYDPGYDYRCH